MNIDNDKVDEAVLALLLLGLHDGSRAWKGFDWESLSRLHEKALISDPRGKAKSVVFTEEGRRMAELLFEKLFDSDETAAREPSEHVFAIVRVDDYGGSLEKYVTVKEIVRSLDIAESEVNRLNELNAGKHCKYFWQTTRLFPPGTCAGNRKGETE